MIATFVFQDWAISFVSVLLEGIPFLLLGSLLSGIVEAFVPARVLARMLPSGRASSVFLAGLLGMIFPVCECGSVVVIRRFLRKGLPVSCAITYMLAAPIVNPVVLLSTLAAFKGQDPWLMGILRLGVGYLVAVGAGLVLGKVRRESLLQPDLLEGEQTAKRNRLTIGAVPESGSDPIDLLSFRQKIQRAVQVAGSDFLDVTVYLIIGVAITSVFNTAIPRQAILGISSHGLGSILLLMALAVPLALCSSSDAFVAASFLEFPLVAKLGFLVYGPMFDAKLFFLYGMLFRRKYVVGLALGLFVVIALICLRLQFLQS